MATLATILDRFMAVKGSDRTAPRTRVMELEDPFVVPQFPNEDVFFYIKRINNANVLRETDPAARRACWKLIGTTFALAVVVIGLLFPTLYGLVAGYKMEALRQERSRLELDRASLELQESKLLNPARLEELARNQQFVDPAPQAVVYLESKQNSVLQAARR
jgi:hypothetical protein